MPNHTPYTSDFIAVPADQVRVRGLPDRSAGAGIVGRGILSSLAGIFTISPDVTRFLPPASVSVAFKPVLVPAFSDDYVSDEDEQRLNEAAEARIGALLSIGD
jgi:hypothetical protein